MLELSFEFEQGKHQFTLMLQESINAFYKSYNTVLVQIMANKCCNIPQYV